MDKWSYYGPQELTTQLGTFRVKVHRSKANWELVLKFRGKFLYFKYKLESHFFQYSFISFIHSIS